ncbi:unnamed protein product [Paramecium pentaurelia]|uniref:PARP catalytic domain-containing protein n=1 Tax=Paramecium pentaurelia TaxID=43138 RepID=A0A8S1VFX7_9CILI|nr:unnamed protein product [Paramecium pentaurelia]
MSNPSQIFKQNNAKKYKSEIVQQNKSNDDNFAFIQYNIQSEIRLKNKHTIKEQIEHLQKEIQTLDQISDEINEDQRKYRKSRLKLQLMQVLRQSEHVSSIKIPQIDQKIEVNNQELMLYVLKEALARDQNREIFMTDGINSCGFDSIIGAFGQDQYCLRFRTTEVEYQQLISDIMFREQYLLNFKENISKIWKVSPSDVVILDITKGSSIILFKIQSKGDLNNDPELMQFFEQNCNGKIDIYNYFVKCNEQKKSEIGIKLEDFDHRGPPNYRYEYYFPKGCQGYGLNIDKYGEDQNWIKMNGNKDEWRILFHGTRNEYVKDIIKTTLKPGEMSYYQNDLCTDEFGNQVRVGNGIYFSDQFNVCINRGYASPIEIQNKKFSAIFMTRVNPKKIRQSDKMKQQRYFLVNNSEDVRQYRILLYEVK